MAKRQITYLPITEYEKATFPKGLISEPDLERLYRIHGNKICVEFPNPITDYKIQITSQGWVGYIPINPYQTLELRPKVPIQNIFIMLEYAYGLKNIKFLDGLIECKTIKSFYERLAFFLSSCVLKRFKKGFYRSYLEKLDRLPYACGRLDLRRALSKPYDINLPYHYENHTADIRENQILVWTLFCIARSGLCSDQSLPVIRKAYRSLRGLVSVIPCSPKDCVQIFYNRLNDDYKPLHIICRFILEHLGPLHERGGRMMLPFLVDMNRLYELFIAKWLELPAAS